MYRIMRYFSIASLASIGLATLLITLIYRQMAIHGITNLGEKINVELAHTALHPVRAELLRYLATVGNIDEPGAVVPRVGADLERDIQDVMADTAVVRIKIYNRRGIVVFSTKSGEIGRNQLEHGDRYENKGFKSAIDGKEANKLVYVDAFNIFTAGDEDDNLMQTYLPLRRTVTAPVEGVFEIYTDARPLVDYAQYTQIAVASVAAIIMALLYLVLLMIVRRAEKVIDSQESTIRDRTHTLELLSAQLLTAQESERAHLADALNEDIAQTLSGINFQVERASNLVETQSTEENVKSLTAITSAVQDAIRKVSAMAMDLRPPSLDDLGVVATLHWYLREYQSRHPEIQLDSNITLQEGDVSRPLKVIIYRIVHEALESIAKYSLPNQVSVSLSKGADEIRLGIEDGGRLYASGEAARQAGEGKRIWLHALQERAVLSGGSVSVEDTAAQGYRINFTWEV